MKKLLSIITLAITILGFTTTAQAAEKSALGEYCPVCYIAAGKAVKGDSKFQATHNEKTYYFISEETKKTFEKNPSKYLPQYDGWCAYGVAKGKKFKSDPTVFTVENGKLYLNLNKSIGKKFEADKKELIAKADKNWPAVMKK